MRPFAVLDVTTKKTDVTTCPVLDPRMFIARLMMCLEPCQPTAPAGLETWDSLCKEAAALALDPDASAYKLLLVQYLVGI